MEAIVIIPAYKPSKSIIELVHRLKKHFQRVIVVDDGGGSEYKDIFTQLEKETGCVVLYHNTNMGKGRALKTAFDYCLNLDLKECSGAITMDADGQHSIEDVVKIAAAMQKNQNAIVLGIRDFSGKDVPPRSKMGNNITRFVFRWLCGIKISDTQTGLRGIPVSYFEKSCKIDGDRYEYETNVLLSSKTDGIKLVEVPIKTIYEDNNSGSHFNTVFDSLKIYKVILMYSLSSILSVIIEYLAFSIFVNAGISIFCSTYYGRLISCGVNFIVNRKVVFKAGGNVFVHLLKYLILVAISATISGFAVTYLANKIGLNPVILKIPVDTVLYFVNYYIQNNYIFKENK